MPKSKAVSHIELNQSVMPAPIKRVVAPFSRMKTMMQTITKTIVAAAFILGLSACVNDRPTETIRANADYRFRGGDLTLARDEYAEIVSRNPGDWEAQYKLGLCMMKTAEASGPHRGSELSGARRALEVAYAARPNDQEVANALSEVMFLQKDESRLFAFLRDRATTTQTIPAYIQLAHYSVELGDPDSAQTAIETAIQIDNSQTTEPYLEAAHLEERLGHMDEAVRRLRQAYGIKPDDHRVWDRLRALGESPENTSPVMPGK